jgi:hypothetical protein
VESGLRIADCGFGLEFGISDLEFGIGNLFEFEFGIACVVMGGTYQKILGWEGWFTPADSKASTKRVGRRT